MVGPEAVRVGLEVAPDARLADAMAAVVPARARAMRADTQTGPETGRLMPPAEAAVIAPSSDLAPAAQPFEAVAILGPGVTGLISPPVAGPVAYQPFPAEAGAVLSHVRRADREAGGRDDPAREGVADAVPAVPGGRRSQLRRPPRRAPPSDVRPEEARTSISEPRCWRRPVPGADPSPSRPGSATGRLDNGAMVAIRGHPPKKDHGRRDIARGVIAPEDAIAFARDDLAGRGSARATFARPTTPRHAAAAARAARRERDAGEDRVPRETGPETVERPRHSGGHVGPDISPDADMAKGAAYTGTPAPSPFPAVQDDVAASPVGPYAVLPVQGLFAAPGPAIDGAEATAMGRAHALQVPGRPMEGGHPLVPAAAKRREGRRGHRGPVVTPVATSPLMATARVGPTGLRRRGVVAPARATNTLGRGLVPPPVRVAHAVDGLVLDGVAPWRAPPPRVAGRPEGVAGRITPP